MLNDMTMQGLLSVRFHVNHCGRKMGNKTFRKENTCYLEIGADSCPELRHKFGAGFALNEVLFPKRSIEMMGA